MVLLILLRTLCEFCLVPQIIPYALDQGEHACKQPYLKKKLQAFTLGRHGCVSHVGKKLCDRPIKVGLLGKEKRKKLGFHLK
jgi:hypothetical protein